MTNTSLNLPSVTPIQDNPALSLTLNGLHLIEASAGTGKTWTLSALIVRLILEGNYVPRQMIATTFTRAAAAELRSRIRQRLEEVRRVIKSLLALQLAHFKSLPESAERKEADQARALLQADIDADLFLDYLVKCIGAGKFGTTDHAIAQNGWTHCLNRLDLALQGFDELFVGTLDSFCQKLLSEFAFESGQGERLQISEQEQELCGEILHDALRKWRAAQDPRLIVMLLQTKKLHDGDAYQYSVGTVMNFLSAELAPIQMPTLDFSRLERLEVALRDLDLRLYDDFIQPHGAARLGMTKSKYLYKFGSKLPDLVNSLQKFGARFLLSIEKGSDEANLLSSFEPTSLAQQFNKKFEHFHAQLLRIGTTDILSELAQIKAELATQLDQVEQHLTFVLSQTVRERLPVLLAERGETSFSQQMRLLANALDDPDNGATLAQQIRHRYPVALVDEFQDTNTDQDRMIARVYRTQPLDPAVCLILVGDPKQAIYGFRGGDVQTYLQVRAEIERAQHQKQGRLHGLTVNHRSIEPLVQSVNALFSCNIDLGDGIEYPQISAGERPHPSLQEHGADNPSPLRLLCLSDAKQEAAQIAWQVMQLLTQAAQGELLFDGKPLQAEHIAVLGYANRDLDQVQSLLQEAKIAVWRPSRCSVFASPIAGDLAALLHLLLSPYAEGRLRRGLSGPLVGWDLAQLDQLAADARALVRQQMAFADDGQVWTRQGFLAAWHSMADRLAIWTHLATLPDAERHLVNLRHLLELLHEESEHRGGTHHLLGWLQRQIAQPKTREWEMERRLPSQSGVQLMTIHASKGLEFPIVLLQGMDRRRTKKADVVFYMRPAVGQRAAQRVLGFQDKTQQHVEQHHARVMAEQRRLAYVALTRASHRLYLPLIEKPAKLHSNYYEAVLSYWLNSNLADWVDAQAGRARVEPLLTAAPNMAALVAQTEPNSAAALLVARPLPTRRLQSWGTTSFSAMTREHDSRQLAAVLDQPDQKDDEDEPLDDLELGLSAVSLPLASLPVQQPRVAAVRVNPVAFTPDRPPLPPEPDIEWDGVQNAFADQDWLRKDVDQIDGRVSGQDFEPYFEPDVEPDIADFSADFSASFSDKAAALDVASARPDFGDIPPPDEAFYARELIDPIWQQDEWLLPDPAASSPLTARDDGLDDPIRFEFVGKTLGGNCLHKILEYIDPSDSTDWINTFSKQMEAHAITGVDAASMLPWFEHIVHATLPDGATLAKIAFRDRVREMPFHLSLPSAEVDSHRLLGRLAQSGVQINSSLRHTHAVRYLIGSIDLVYQHAGRFYIADYKSNFLSKNPSLADYSTVNMRAAMDRSGYWLQAALYLVVLHRYLKVRLPNYQIEQHLGGATYLFLRGMRAGDAEQGIVTWRPESALIEDIDSILGSVRHD